MLDVPVNRVVQRLPPIPARTPAELIPDTTGVDAVASVVTRSIVDVANQSERLTDTLQDGVNNLEVLALILGPDVVRRAGGALAEDGVDRGDVVLDVQPIANLPPVAIHREWQ